MASLVGNAIVPFFAVKAAIERMNALGEDTVTLGNLYKEMQDALGGGDE